MLGNGFRTLRDGMAAAIARDFDNAYQLLQRATNECPTDVRAWLWRAVASPTPADATACLRRVLALEPDHPEAQQALARLLAGQAAGLSAEGRRADAASLAREAAGLAPDCDATWVALAGLSDDPQERLDALRRAKDLNPQVQQTRVLLRDALLHAGIASAGSNQDAARALFREASAVDPSDPRVWQALSRMAANAAEALDAHRQLFRLAPDRPGVRASLKRALAADAESCAAAGSTGDAIARWREAIALDDQDAANWLGLAGVTQDRDEALRALAVVRRAGLEDARIAAVASRWEAADDPQPADDPFAFPELEPFVAPAPPAPSAPPPPLAPEPIFTPTFSLAPTPAPAPAVNDPFAAAAAPAPAPAADPFAAFAPPPAASAPSRLPGPAGDEPPAEPLIAFAPPAEPLIAFAPPAAPVAPAPAPPVAAAPVAAAPPQAAAPARPADGPHGKRTVMIVDDSPTVRKILSMTLERAGYGVVSAADGEAALDTLANAVPDLILLDISMPKLDGYEVCKRVKADARTAHVPVVMLSGKDAFFDKVKGRMAGATEYLTKPFATPAVLAAVGRMFEPETGAVHG